MTREEKKRELTRMLKKAPEILSPRKAAQWSPLGRNAVYDLIHTGELRSFRYRDGCIIPRVHLCERNRGSHQAQLCDGTVSEVAG